MAGGNYSTVTVNNAAAGVLAKAVVTMGPTTLTAGTMQISDTLVYAATSTSNAITQSAGSVLTLNNSQTLLPTLDNVARNSFGGYYSILHSVYDKANSTFGGVSLSSISYSQYINADRLILSSGGQITFPDATVQATAFTTSPTLNILKVDDGVHEKFQAKADATGIVTHDCSLGHIFYHTSPDALFTVNFTNLNLSSGYATALTLIIVQGGTGFIPNSVGIGGVIQTLNWQGNVTPTPSTNRTDVVTFSIICTATDTYTVLGQLTGF
jgi:hypothetical protein